MSHFPNMFASGSNDRSYLVKINRHGEVFVAKLGPNGEIMEFVAGDLMQTLGPPIKEANPKYRLVQISGWNRRKILRPHNYRLLDGKRWRDLVKTLNGKGIAAGRARIGLYVECKIFEQEIPEIDCEDDYWSGPWKLSPQGEKTDALLDEEDARERVAANGEST